MSGKKSKRLGKDFEYEVRDLLREQTGIESFERVPTSGAWIGGQNSYKAQTGREDVTEIMAGDLICPPEWRWTVECKNHVDIPIHQLFLGEGCQSVDEFLHQLLQSSQTANKEPLLFMKWRVSGSRLPERIRKTLKENNIDEPKSNTQTRGILVAERIEHCEDISSLNHIQYSQDIGIRWRFFDYYIWADYLNDRYNKS